MNRIVTTLAIIILLCSSWIAQAANTAPLQPAATLLLPYFEVDPIPNFPNGYEFANPKGLHTTVTLANASAAAVLARVTVWTDYGIPTLSFHLYFTGFDMEIIDLRQLFDGVLPRSADDSEDVNDTISHQGPQSQDINYASCTVVHNAQRMPAEDIIALRNAHSGQPSALFGNLCASRDHGDGVLRGYLSVDTVNACNGSLLPNDAAYAGLLSNQNILWGRWTLLDSNNNYSDSGALVSVRSLVDVEQTPFYRRFNDDPTRGALGNVWGARYLSAGLFDQGTDLRVWREPRSKPQPVQCADSAPPFLPAGQAQIVVFDEQENPALINNAQPFPLTTQRVSVDDLPLPFNSGWLYLNLDHDNATAAQSYVSAVHNAAGRFRFGNDAVMLHHTDSGPSALLPNP